MHAYHNGPFEISNKPASIRFRNSYGVPTRPALAGAVAGLLAGGLAASFYAAHCTDDSPLFVTTRADAVFATPDEISGFIQQECR